MKFNIGRWTVVILLSIFMLACTSIRTRTEILHNKQWTVYPGAKQDLKEIQQLANGEPLQSSDDNYSESGWMKGVIAAILTFDLPFSTVFDTIAAPYDLYRIDNPQSFEEDHTSSSSSAPRSPEK